MIWTPQNTLSRPRTTKVIDVNHNNPISDKTLSAKGIDGVIVKITQGNSFVDPSAKASLAMLKQTKRLRGGYHFTEPGPGAIQAKFFWTHLLEALGGKYDNSVNVTLDLEPGTHGNMAIKDAEDWVKYIHDECIGSWPLVYGGGGLLRDAFETGGHTKSVLLKCGLFLADPRTNWKIIPGWQRFMMRQKSEDTDEPGWDYDEYLAEAGSDPVSELHFKWPLHMSDSK